MGEPFVTAIIASYAQPEFLNAALESVAAQTYPSMEIIVVDDDSPPELVAQYRLPANARLIRQQPRRAMAAASRNRALAEARGKYVAFLDQDDLWMPEKIAVQVAALENRSDAPLHFVQYEKVDEHLRSLPKQPKRSCPGRDPLRWILHRNCINPSQVMVRRSLFERVGGFDENIRCASDWDLWLRAAAEGAFLSDERRLTRYRIHPGQWSRQSLQMVMGMEAVLAKAERWLPAKRPDLRGLLRRRHARWLREVARVQLELRQEPRRTTDVLGEALRLNPLGLKTYYYLLKALAGGKRRRREAFCR